MVLLKYVLEESKFEPCWQRCPTVLLWILVIGGIAASETGERMWYVQNLGTVAAVLGIWGWEDVAEELGEYLWLESTCDAGGRALWAEAVRNKRVVEEFNGGENPRS